MTPERSRDDTVDALLRSMTDGEDSRSSTGCPEPSVLAARYERALTKEESAHLDGHLASCDRCRGLLALIVKSEPAEPAEPTHGGWLLRRRWLVPTVATLAASAMLWVAIDPTRQLEEPQRQTDFASAARQRVVPQEPARPDAGPQPEAPAPRAEQAAPASTELARVPPEPAPAPAEVRTQRREARPATPPADADAQERGPSGVAAVSAEAVAIEVPSLADPPSAGDSVRAAPSTGRVMVAPRGRRRTAVRPSTSSRARPRRSPSAGPRVETASSFARQTARPGRGSNLRPPKT